MWMETILRCNGIPVGVKDFFDTAGIRTTAAFAAFQDRMPTQDAEVVTQLKAAGAIVLGKLNMHEPGMGTTSLTNVSSDSAIPRRCCRVQGDYPNKE
jgi:Asp-tRNA(Asn)/Glu-tRNA(Gln) amidotransferase A subunit family amidase